ncbi:indolepyruvate oxidoreductase subunit beta family protein [Achromobacter sp. GG226]|uniref:indolepyruvate oxidoreductase subunit beta family protein n=1 Tax=Verticiella alkaliphila TaxID=2779529 RepID=UPI001C0E3934|nr:indolepyruvate oxidoreductase subunit beta family protein [Verticiella sp. GG226]MBU4610914.1 indolepyruvate oxidoreductase subunit beta family protein [Verticiella sp. GG226]
MNARPVSILVAALGGEGGGVLSDWIVTAATYLDYPVQSTSVPGVAQRTGATTYYLEIFPVARRELGGREPVLSLTPNPGDVTLVAASELVEAGRMLQAGYVDPGRTTLVASTHREYSVAEKSAMGDGRYDVERILRTARDQAHTPLLLDLATVAARHRTIINTVLFGVMAGSGALPLSREACEHAIREAGKAVDTSLAGFAAGFALAQEALAAPPARVAPGHVAQTPPAQADTLVATAVRRPDATPAAGAAGEPGPTADAAGHGAAVDARRDETAATRGRAQGTPSSSTAVAPAHARARIAALPAELNDIVSAGAAQTLDYQGKRYTDRYLDRVERLLAAEQAAAAPTLDVTRETARYLALWMTYEDVIRVADLKTRRTRLARVRREVGAREDEPVRVTEFLKPGLDEICSVLPTRPAAWLRRRLAHKAHALNVGLHVRTSSVSGFALLCALRSLRPLRPRTSRFAAEQAMIDRWLGAVQAALARSPALALELALCGNLVKGYGDTSERGHRNLTAILEDAEQRTGDAPDMLAQRVATARKAALADPEGRSLAGALDRPPPPLVAKPIHFVRKRPVQGAAPSP